ncbi:hypothetical protein E2C01_064979 [Portunus trituberculatus]|uniref:Uncharacterized protein n=1 Tax=Portunus trituberculatus TaxID=210409 RepID=A0A5B7HM96_PORTR|nr:hypothetical protein [Portunus trituberculatus]
MIPVSRVIRLCSCAGSLALPRWPAVPGSDQRSSRRMEAEETISQQQYPAVINSPLSNISIQPSLHTAALPLYSLTYPSLYAFLHSRFLPPRLSYAPPIFSRSQKPWRKRHVEKKK